MSTTTDRPLPTDRATLASYLPAAPTGTTVSALRDALARINELTVSERGRLDQIERDDRAIVLELVDQAVAGEPVGSIVGRASAGDRAAIEHRLSLLQSAFQVASTRLAVAERSDEQHLAWLTETRRTTEEWQRVMSIDDSGDRFAALTTFARVH